MPIACEHFVVLPSSLWLKVSTRNTLDSLKEHDEDDLPTRSKSGSSPDQSNSVSRQASNILVPPPSSIAMPPSSPFSNPSPAPSPAIYSRSTTPPLSYDWSSFIAAYASGKWNPHRTPNPPAPSSHSGSKDSSPPSSSNGEFTIPGTGPTSMSKRSGSTQSMSLTPLRNRNSVPTSSIGPPKQSAKHNLYIPLASSANPNSIALPSPFITPPSTSPTLSHSHALNVTHSAATLRLAGTNINIAPLALPSPEHELTDPMRGMNTTIPGHDDFQFDDNPDPVHHRDGSVESMTRRRRLVSHSPLVGPPISDFGSSPNGEAVFTPDGSKRRSFARMEGFKEFWGGTRDIEAVDTPSETVDADSPIPATSNASMPSESQTEAPDYFSRDITSGRVLQFHPGPILHSNAARIVPLHMLGSMSVPIPNTCTDTPVVSRVSMTRQASAPLPTTNLIDLASMTMQSGESTVTHSPHLSIQASGESPCAININVEHPTPMANPVSTTAPATPSLQPSTVAAAINSSRIQKDEALYLQLGYLIPPHPPDEFERKRALSKLGFIPVLIVCDAHFLFTGLISGKLAQT